MFFKKLATLDIQKNVIAVMITKLLKPYSFSCYVQYTNKVIV